MSYKIREGDIVQLTETGVTELSAYEGRRDVPYLVRNIEPNGTRVLVPATKNPEHQFKNRDVLYALSHYVELHEATLEEQLNKIFR